MLTRAQSIPTRDRYLSNALMLAAHVMGEERRDRIFSRTQARVAARITNSMQQGGASRRLPLERRGVLSPREFKDEYLSKGKPVVMAGAAADWPCVKKWSLDVPG